MSSEEILQISKRLCSLGCPFEILGCNPMKVAEEEKFSVLETCSNLLLQPSQNRNELLKWTDLQIFGEDDYDFNEQKSSVRNLDEMYKIKEHLSCIISDDTAGFFGQVAQVS